MQQVLCQVKGIQTSHPALKEGWVEGRAASAAAAWRRQGPLGEREQAIGGG
jgi:hypothetical protein